MGHHRPGLALPPSAGTDGPSWLGWWPCPLSRQHPPSFCRGSSPSSPLSNPGFPSWLQAQGRVDRTLSALGVHGGEAQGTQPPPWPHSALRKCFTSQFRGSHYKHYTQELPSYQPQDKADHGFPQDARRLGGLPHSGPCLMLQRTSLAFFLNSQTPFKLDFKVILSYISNK